MKLGPLNKKEGEKRNESKVFKKVGHPIQEKKEPKNKKKYYLIYVVLFEFIYIYFIIY